MTIEFALSARWCYWNLWNSIFWSLHLNCNLSCWVFKSSKVFSKIPFNHLTMRQLVNWLLTRNKTVRRTKTLLDDGASFVNKKMESNSELVNHQWWFRVWIFRLIIISFSLVSVDLLPIRVNKRTPTLPEEISSFNHFSPLSTLSADEQLALLDICSRPNKFCLFQTHWTTSIQRLVKSFNFNFSFLSDWQTA